MYEVVQAGKQSYYIQCPAKIGIYLRNERDVYLIDSGSDKDAGRRVRKILDAHGWNLKGILNTHSHADHIGGNHYLQQQYGCKIFMGGMEAAFTRQPVLEPSFLYGGYPFKDIKHKFLMAEASETTEFSDADFPKEIEIIPLPGHSLEMVGFRIPDGTVFLADCLSSTAALEKYQISFIYDIPAYLDTLDTAAALPAEMLVPAHADAAPDIRPLTDINKKKVFEIAEHIRMVCREPLCFERILQQLFADYNLQMTYEQYVLVGSTVRSYLSWLKDLGQMEGSFENNQLLWKCSV